jgi:hypothetical protein
MSMNSSTICSSSINTFSAATRDAVLGRLIVQLRGSDVGCTVNLTSIDGCTINGRSTSKNIVINRLLSQIVHRTSRSAGGGAGPTRERQWLKPPDRGDRDVKQPTELDGIVVTVQLQDLIGTAMQQVSTAFDLVYVTDLMIEPTELIVNIEDLEITC